MKSFLIVAIAATLTYVFTAFTHANILAMNINFK